MKVNDVYDLTVSIVNKANDLKNKYTDEIKANVDFIHAKYGFEPNLECEKHINDIIELKDLL